MGHHAGRITVQASGQSRDDAIERCCRLVGEATREPVASEYSGRQPHWILDDSSTDVVTTQTMGGEPTLAGVDVTATFVWKGTS